IVSTDSQFDALQGEWTRLFAESGSKIFLSWEYMRTWWAHFHDGKRLFIITARDGDGRLVGLAPLKISRRAYRKVPFRQLEFIGYGPELAPDFLDILAAPGRRDDVLKAVGRAICDARSAWDVLLLSDMAS